MERFKKKFFKALSKEDKLQWSKIDTKKIALLKSKEIDNFKIAKKFENLTPAELQLLLDNVVYPEDMDYVGINESLCFKTRFIVFLRYNR